MIIIIFSSIIIIISLSFIIIFYNIEKLLTQ